MTSRRAATMTISSSATKPGPNRNSVSFPMTAGQKAKTSSIYLKVPLI